MLRRMGWSIKGKLPDLEKYVCIGAPHTSNWDFVICILFRYATGMPVKFLAKNSLFKPPFGWFFRMVGGYPVDRAKANKLVDAVVDIFNREQSFALALAPEGTRGEVGRWKTGFYHIATQANVPILMLGLDFPSRTVVLSEPFFPTGNIKEDFAKIREFYVDIKGLVDHPLPDPLI
jgi:1-acyl-sn-glycerol-3-phosphate acyltransferase